MQNKVKLEFKEDFAGKSKGYVGEYSKDNAHILIKNGIADIIEDSLKGSKAKKVKKPE